MNHNITIYRASPLVFSAVYIYLFLCLPLLSLSQENESHALLKSAVEQERTPKQQTVLAGNNTSINCSLDFEYRFGTAAVNDEVFWRWKPRNSTEWLNVTNPETNKNVNFSKDEDHRREVILSAIQLTNVSVSSSGLYACFLENGNKMLDKTDLFVGYPPDIPQRLECQTNGMLSTMTCCWDPGRPTYIPTTFQLSYYTEATQHYNKSVRLPTIDIDVSTTYSYTYTIHIAAVNALDETSSQCWSGEPHQLVIPDPPTNVNVTSYTSTSLTIAWEIPSVNTLVNLEYRIRYRRSHYKDEKWELQDADEPENNLIQQLEPYTSYDVQVSAKPVRSAFISGFFSEWSNLETFRTGLSAPTSPFYFLTINATSLTKDVNSEWEITMVWHSYAKLDEPGFYYDITYYESGHEYQIPAQTNLASFTVHGKTLIKISGRHCNEVGCSAAKTEELKLQEALPPVENVQLSNTTESFVVTWDSKLTNECVVRICTAPRKASIKDNTEDISVQHCDPSRDQVTACTSGNIKTKNYDISPCYQLFAVVLTKVETGVKNIMTSSGSDSVTRAPVIATETMNFSALDMSVPDKYLITTRWDWSESLCNNLHHDLLLSVVYTPIAGAECLATKSCSEDRMFQSPVGNCSERLTSHNVTSNIYGATVYKIDLEYCCKSAAKLMDSPCFAASSDTDTAKTPTGVPGIPLKLLSKADEFITVSWLPPEHPNGNLDGYHLRYGEAVNASEPENSKSNRTRRSTDTLTNVTQETSMELPIPCSTENVETVYWVKVAAFNNINNVESEGPAATLEGCLCKESSLEVTSPDEIVHYAPLIAGLIVVLLIIFLALLLCHYYRKRIKQVVRKALWPSVPEPNIMIPFPDHMINDEEEDEDPDARSNPLFHNPSGQNDNSEIVFHEIPDDITSIRKVLAMRKEQKKETLHNNVHGKQRQRDAQMEEQSYPEGMFIEADERAPILRLQSSSSSPRDEFDHSGQTQYSVVTPLISDSSAGTNFSFTKNTRETTSSWRGMLYPRTMRNSAGTGTQRRPNSYAGSSAFNQQDYLRECEDFQQNQADFRPSSPSTKRKVSSSNDKDPDPVVTYTMLAVDPEDGIIFTEISDQPTFHDQTTSCTAQPASRLTDRPLNENYTYSGMQELRRVRGESWYDGYSIFDQTASSPAMGEQAQSRTDVPSDMPSYLDYAASYVTDPKPAHHVPCNDVTVDSCACAVSVERDSQHQLSGNWFGSSDSIDRLYPAIREAHTAHGNPAMSNDLSRNWDEVDSTTALPEDSLSPYLQQTVNYVTMNDALNHDPGPSIDNRSSSSNRSPTFQSQAGELFLNDFEVQDGSFNSLLLRNAVSRLLSTDTPEDNSSPQTPSSSNAVEDSLGEGGYVTTAEAVSFM